MSQHQFDRRTVLTFGAATAMGVWSGFGATAGPLEGRQPDAPKGQALQFSVTIPGLPETSRNIREIAIDDLAIDPRQTQGRDQDFWVIGPARIHLGSATFTVAAAKGSLQELSGWFTDTLNAKGKGKNIRKDITVRLFNADTGAERTYHLFECFPTAFSAVNFDTSSTVQTETLKVNIGRIEFTT